MVEIENKIVETIEADSTIINLLGGSSSDSRVYKWYPYKNHDFSSDQPAILLYHLIQLNRGGINWSYPDQIGNFVIVFRILSIDLLIADQLGDALITLFDKTSLQTDNYTIKWIELNNRGSDEPEGSKVTPLFNVTVSFQLNNAFKR